MTISEVSNGYEVSFQYKPYLVDAIKKIPGAKFNGAGKYWHVPHQSGPALLNWAKHFGAGVNHSKAIEVGEIDPLPELIVDIPLQRNLFPYQKTGVAYSLQKKRVIVGDQPGLGKAQPLDALIATADGFITMGKAAVGMKVLGADGNTYSIEGVYPQGKRPVYKVSFNDGTSVECDEDHLWQVRDVNRRRRNTGWIVKSTKELLAAGIAYRANEARQSTGRKPILKWEIPLAKAFEGTERNYVIHPYILGALLGDGCISGNEVSISIPDSQIETKERIEQLLPGNLKLWLNKHTDCPQYYITQTGTTNKNPFMLEIKRLGLNVKGRAKFIPEEYMFGSKAQRLDLLRGLMDTDGSAKKNRITYHTVSRSLAESLADLVFSLGGQAIIREYDRSEEGKSNEFQVNVRMRVCPFYMKRKLQQWSVPHRNYASKYIESITYVGEKETQCIKVTAPDHLYLTNHFIVTHNTGQAIATMMGAGCKCILVICPATLRENWKREWQIWTGRQAMVLSDRVKNTWMQYYKVGLCNVFITNYESLKKYFIQEINKPEDKPLRLNHIKFRDSINLFDAVIIDEIHRCKDGKTQTSKFCMGIAKGKEYVLGLTGTPVVNKPIDLIPQLYIIQQLHVFGGYKGFVDRYCQGYSQASNLKELNFLMHKNCFYRREKQEVLKDLPDKIRSIVRVEITNRAEYVKAENNFIEYLRENLGKSEGEISKSLRGEIMVQMSILKKVAARGKIQAFLESVQEVVEAGEKIVLFAWHKEIVHELKSAIPGAVTIVGDDSMEQRQKAVDAFQNDPKVQEIICNIKSGGVGITLTAASRVSFIELPWHPADCEQCEDRCHRIGQHDSVHCTYYLGHQTIDEYIYQIIEKKRAIVNQVTGAEEAVETNIVDEFINLFRQDRF